jgi:hypothetical protein
MLKEYEAEATDLKEALKRFTGMTIKEAQNYGWGEKEDRLQGRLWILGYKITDLKNKISKNEKPMD